jgi:hypothetical protein
MRQCVFWRFDSKQSKDKVALVCAKVRHIYRFVALVGTKMRSIIIMIIIMKGPCMDIPQSM